ncbi:DUF4097 family beta strand repeat-containing protein [Candidatus Soleaferrea massiliensis]|uniref:DUF4097 family beta strand repeat-containing protein n=1 Tax=Candidatus Soleaferrea massiliensis TaxID=1470354 RepID=UPI000590F853|nr:DUF4097 family beta strand repeat-containing protein [Candidatus Soleaferrea massiliensis]
MHKLKYLLLAAGLLCAAGLVISGCAFAATGFSFQDIANGPRVEEREHTAKIEGLTGIDVRSENIRVKVVPTAGKDIVVHYLEGDQLTCSITEQNGVLVVESTYLQNWFDQFRFGLFSSLALLEYDITVELPKDYTQALKVQNGNAGISVEDASLTDLDCETSNSSVELTGVTAGTLRAVSSNGHISLQKVSSAGAMQVRNSNSSIKMEDVRAEDTTIEDSNSSIKLIEFAGTGKLHVQNSNGSIYFEDIEVGKTTVKNSNSRVEFDGAQLGLLSISNYNGRIQLKDVTAQESVKASTTNSSVVVEALAGPDLTLRTENGGVRGTIAGKKGEYNILAQTANGSSNLEDQLSDSKNKLQVVTSNGGIDITFTQP